MISRLKEKLGLRSPDPLLAELVEEWGTSTTEGENARLILELERSCVTLKSELKDLSDNYPAINQHFNLLAQRVDSAKTLVREILHHYKTGEARGLAEEIKKIVRIIIGPYTQWECRPEVNQPVLRLENKLTKILETNYDEVVLDKLEYIIRLAKYGVQRNKPRHEPTTEELHPDRGWEDEPEA